MNEKWTGAEDVSFTVVARADDRTQRLCRPKLSERPKEKRPRRLAEQLRRKRRRGGNASDRLLLSERLLLRLGAQPLLGVDRLCAREAEDEGVPSRRRRGVDRLALLEVLARRRAEWAMLAR